MGSARDTSGGQPSPATARDGTRVDSDDAAPEALRVPPRDTDPVDGPPDESGVSSRGKSSASPAPASDVPTPRTTEPDERSAPTVRRADRASGGAPRAEPPPAPVGDGSETTLLSAPAPADAFEVDVDRRLEETERRLEQLEADLARLREAKRAPAERPLGESLLFWVVFLLVIAVAWLFFHGAH